MGLFNAGGHFNAQGLTRKISTFTSTKFFAPNKTYIRKQAFTLAEVLITLGIIGIVAA